MIIGLEKSHIRASIESYLRKEILNPFAILLYGPHAGGYADEEVAINALSIVESSKPILKYYVKRFNSIRVRLLIADKQTFEGDVEKEQLGGMLAEILVTPYEPLLNESYLWEKEVEVKKRIINNILRNLILSFPEMSRVFIIKPEYFMFEAIKERALLFPLIVYKFLNICGREARERNYSLMMRGFTEALKRLLHEGKINVFDGFFRISEEYINSVLKERIDWHLKKLFKSARIRIIRHLIKVLPAIINPLLDEYRIYRKHITRYGGERRAVLKLENPRKYIFIPTSLGMIPFTEKTSIDEFLKKYMSQKYILKHEVKRLGGVLNSVYLLKIFDGEREEKIVVKIFKDWYGWKWFPLALWTLGTKDFTILGRSRLEKEYAINTFLMENGINVPRIIYVAPEEKILFQEFIEGNSLSRIIRALLKDEEDSERRSKLIKIVKQVGEEIAKVHGLGVSIGDCKPENMILSPDGRIFFVDLEQAERGGDQSWDIAEFLYYLGHYASFSGSQCVKEAVGEFIRGYLEANGRIETIRRALSPRYLKVFGILLPPHLILTISNACKRIIESRGVT